MLDRIRFVLHATQHPGNIGAAARAMKNMGLSQLYLVAPERFPHPDAYARAAGADQLLNEAVVVSSLNEALAGCHWVLGTTAQNRSVRLPELAPRQAVDELGPMIASGQEVAIVFGQERTGLENAQLQLCHASICIPTHPDFSSLNLGAAVQVIAYELRLAAMQQVISPPVQSSRSDELPATAEQFEGFFGHLDQALHDIDFHKGRDTEVVMQRLRRLFLKARMDEREVRMLRGILADAQRMARLALHK